MAVPSDVRSCLNSGKYVSCMKINGVPLLPPILSNECRKEMQYYKVLAKEVEKRILMLKHYIQDSDSDVSEHIHNNCKKSAEHQPENKNEHISPMTASNITVINNNDPDQPLSSPKLLIESNDRSKMIEIDMPERDYNCIPNHTKLSKQDNTKHEIDLDIETRPNFFIDKREIMTPPELDFSKDGPSSLSSKSFTGSLNDLHTEYVNDVDSVQPLLRQRSYTVLHPSPQLLAHLEVQSLNTGIKMTSISMSESRSELSPQRKRRSWDLETAKVKWSSMALELSKRRPRNIVGKGTTHQSRPLTKRVPQNTLYRASSMVQERTTKEICNQKNLTKSRLSRNCSPERNIDSKRGTNHATKQIASSKTGENSNSVVVTPDKTLTPVQPMSSPKIEDDSGLNLEDPATRVRELYDKIQKHQLIQMASLVEKQKREQLLLQQVFEQQNNLLYKQLKTICPTTAAAKSPLGDKLDPEADRGPVSLSQLINHKSPNNEVLSSTINVTHNCINECEDVLKKSRNISNGFKTKCDNTPQNVQKQGHKAMNKTIHSTPSFLQKTSSSASKAQIMNISHSPVNCNQKPTSTKQPYDSSSHSEHEDIMLTDRTNDTMADLNFTLTTDESVKCEQSAEKDYIEILQDEVEIPILDHTISTLKHCAKGFFKNINVALNGEVQKSKETHNSKRVNECKSKPTSEEFQAASKIVAYAKGYLVRRLLKTERVQTIVQTIRDALLCALQLHQDREGIRGADIDLHRRLIQQITAACYALHDTFITSTPGDRCAAIALDRERRKNASHLANRSSGGTTPTLRTSATKQFIKRKSDI